MSSHREAPEISKDPVADNTDIYAFVSPDDPSTVTIIAQLHAAAGADGGPNFYEFGDDVLYTINIDNDGDGRADITYEFRVHRPGRRTRTRSSTTPGPIGSLEQPELEPPAVLHGHAIDRRSREVLGTGLACPPCNIGPRSTPNYAALAAAAVRHARAADGVRRPAHRGLLRRPRRRSSTWATCGRSRTCTDQSGSPRRRAPGVDATERPERALDRDPGADRELTGDGSGPTTRRRRRGDRHLGGGEPAEGAGARSRAGGRRAPAPWVQVSRLGNPLFNEVIVPMGSKDQWNALPPADDSSSSPTCSIRSSPALLPGAISGRVPEPGRG